MSTTTPSIPRQIREFLSRDAFADCQICRFADLSNTNYGGPYIRKGSCVVILPGWVADDGNAAVAYRDIDTSEAAAHDYVDTGEWGDVTRTLWLTIYTWRQGYVLDTDGELVELEIDHESHTIELEPDEPECSDDHNHNWCHPLSVVGGIAENPGVFGHGGGVIITAVCSHCGTYRRTDTWAQDMDTGVQGLTSVDYAEADEDSLRWVAEGRCNA